jgi:hypothetical protein
MKNLPRFISLVFCLVLSGCIVTSLQPLYTDKDLIFEPALAGAWTEEKPADDKTTTKESWAFTKAGEKEYKFVYTDKDGKAGEFSAHLLKIGGTLFLDLFPDDPKLAQNDYYKMHLLPAHSFVRISQIEPVLKMSLLDEGWLKKFLKTNPDAISYEQIPDMVVLTAKPKALQRFLKGHLKTKGAFAEETVLKRAPAAVLEPAP